MGKKIKERFQENVSVRELPISDGGDGFIDCMEH
jgi:hypothetical protein